MLACSPARCHRGIHEISLPRHSTPSMAWWQEHNRWRQRRSACSKQPTAVIQHNAVKQTVFAGDERIDCRTMVFQRGL